MFETLTPAPKDAILGLNEAFNADPNPAKINLSVGVYKDAEGRTPVLNCVKNAQARILENERSKSYLGIEGSPEYGRAVQRLLFGPDHEVVAAGRAATAHTPGGTGALRVAGDLLKQSLGKSRIWLTDPTWPNHPGVFQSAGLDIETFPYFDKPNNALAIDALIGRLREVPAGEVVLLHACCHNPTGVDPTPDQWNQIAQVIEAQELIPLVDFAYQGFGDGLAEDARGLATLCAPGRELLVASSFSKNFGLYNERTGALTLVAADAKSADTVLGHAKGRIRANYSNPPAHGGAIVTTVLGDSELSAEWEEEVAAMRNRINGVRQQFAETLAAKGAPGDWSFITRQRGMFSFSGLTAEQVDTLREKYSIYAVRSGRINVAGMTEANMDTLCTAIADVVKQ